MKNITFAQREFFVGLILALSLLWPLFAAPYFSHHDDVQIIRLNQMNKCIEDRQIPCRWVPDLGGEYGYPIFNYYAPLPYYFGELIYLLTHNLIFSAKTMFAISFIGSYVFMYLLAKKFWGKLGGSLSAIFYTYIPYHAVDFYVRGAMGELWAFMLFPAVVLTLVNLEEKSNIKNLIFFSLSFAFLILSHNLSTLMFSPVLLVFVLMFFLKRKSKKFLSLTFLGLILGILISSFYLFPAIFEKNLVHVETTTYGYFSYTEHFKGLRKLFLDDSWSWGSSIREVPGGERDTLPYQIGWVHLLGLILALYSAKVFWKKNEQVLLNGIQNRWLSLIIVSSTVLIFLSVFMIHPRSVFVWKALDSVIKYIQFPWRFLIIIAFLISFISGSFFLENRKKNRLIWLGLILLVLVLNFSHFRPEKFLNVSEQDLLTGQNWDKQIKRSIYDYLPIYAKEPPAELATERYEILTGDSRILDFKEGSNWFKYKTETNTHTIIRMSQYYFPEWKILIDSKEVNIEYTNNSLGLMTIILGKGNHTVEGRLYDTPVRLISNLVSALSFGVVLLLLIFQFKNVRNWMMYYRKRIN